MDNNNVQVKKNSFGSIFAKTYLIIVGIGVGLFFLCAIIKLIISVVNGSTIDSSLMYLFQIILPILLIIFGWIPALAVASSKSKKN